MPGNHHSDNYRVSLSATAIIGETKSCTASMGPARAYPQLSILIECNGALVELHDFYVGADDGIDQLRGQRAYVMKELKELKILRALTSAADRRRVNQIEDSIETQTFVLKRFNKLTAAARTESRSMEGRVVRLRTYLEMN